MSTGGVPPEDNGVLEPPPPQPARTAQQRQTPVSMVRAILLVNVFFDCAGNRAGDVIWRWIMVALVLLFGSWRDLSCWRACLLVPDGLDALADERIAHHGGDMPTAGRGEA